MLAVGNASPISNLAFIGRLDLLKAQFPVVWIPSAVAQELAAHPDRIALDSIQAAITAQWIRTAVTQESHLLKILSPQLHRGEAEAIALAADLKADFVIIDEQEGRQLATQAGLSIIGVLGILLRAKHRGQIPAVKPELRALRDRAASSSRRCLRQEYSLSPVNDTASAVREFWRDSLPHALAANHTVRYPFEPRDPQRHRNCPPLTSRSRTLARRLRGGSCVALLDSLSASGIFPLCPEREGRPFRAPSIPSYQEESPLLIFGLRIQPSMVSMKGDKKHSVSLLSISVVSICTPG